MGWFKKTGSSVVKKVGRVVAVDELKQGYDANISMVRNAVRYNLTKRAPPTEPFSMPTERYIEIQKSFRKIVFFFIFLFFFAILYTMASAITHNWKLVFLSLAFGTLCLAFAFRYHFWLYQMKRKMLGCTFQDWYRDEVQARFKSRVKKG
jgi:hypothetical protein